MKSRSRTIKVKVYDSKSLLLFEMGITIKVNVYDSKSLLLFEMGIKNTWVLEKISCPNIFKMENLPANETRILTCKYKE